MKNFDSFCLLFCKFLVVIVVVISISFVLSNTVVPAIAKYKLNSATSTQAGSKSLGYR